VAKIHKKKAGHSAKKLTPKLQFDKYELYREAVQSAETDVVFLRDSYKELKKKNPRTMREDFCGTFALSCEWIKLDPNHTAVGIDLDPEPMAYGRQHYLTELTPAQQKRMTLIEDNVMNLALPKADLVIAMNFSYFLFKTRELMKQYFTNVYKGVNDDGIFLLDLFGGKQCQAEIEDTKKVGKSTYYWDQTGFDPVTNEALFHIHFRVNGKKIENVFTYDWRMWTIPELREIMAEVGFKKSHVYWEGTAKDGSGDGKFSRTEKGEACDSWIAYIIAEK
jgi:hypothetical protein